MRSLTRMLSLVVITSLYLAAVCYAVSEDLEVTGDIRWRLRHVDSGRTGTLEGTYGEFLSRGFSEKHRLVLEVAYPVASAIRVGGMIRVSNEDEAVLKSGPEYLSSDFGSVFIEYKTPSLMTRFGYFSVDYTPLTMMRWDLEDDPEGGGGGCAVCGGPGGAGAILGETLEELGPKLTFEGVKVEASPSETFGTSAFFARSDIASETYPVITFGGRAGYKKYLKRTSSFLDIAAIVVRSQDDRTSTESDPSVEADTTFSKVVYGITCDVPIVRGVSFKGEWTLGRSEREDLGKPEMFRWRAETQGKGAMGTLIAEVVPNLSVAASYLYLSRNWDSYFRALSYNPNRRGMRVRVEYGDDKLLVALFAKYLQTISATMSDAGDTPETLVYPTLSARCYAEVAPNLDLGLAAIYSGRGAKEGSLTLDVESKTLTWLGSLAYDFGKDSAVTLEERYVQHRDEADTDYEVSMLSLYVRSGIW
jgi:hypothetical protein